MRPQKAKDLKTLADAIFKKTELEIHRYDNVIISPVGQLFEKPKSEEGIIMDDTGMSSSVCASEGSSYEPKLNGTVLYAGFLHRKWGHFITESLARLWPVIDGHEFDKILFFTTVPGNLGLHGNYLELLQLLGISDKVIISDSPYIVDELYVPDLAYEHDVFYSDKQKSVYDSIVHAAISVNNSNQQNAESTKVFLSRAQFKGAATNSINIKELEEFFAKNGYEIVNPEQLNLQQCIRLLVNASCIATISGTLAHNFVFAGDTSDKQIVIIERHGWINSFQASLNKMMDMAPIHVDGYYLPKPSSSQDGIMLFAPTPQFLQFAHDNNMIDAHFVKDSLRVRHNELHRFIKRYRRYYGSGDGVLPWEIESGQSIIEAMIASRERYGEWLTNYLPVTWHDMLTPRFVARSLKYLLKQRFR